MTDSTDGHDGGCLCGAIRYRVRGAPSTSMLCHCRSCRRATASPVVAWVTFPKSAVIFMQGAPTAFQSSPGVVRTFCGACGTPLTYATELAPEEIDITTCSLDDPEAFPPMHHAWMRHRLRWLRPGDGLPAYRGAGRDPDE